MLKSIIQTITQKSRENPWAYTIFALAFAARLIYIIEKSINDPSFAFPMVDELWHWRWANEILTVSFWGDDSWFRAPLYAYFLAFLKKLTDFLTVSGEPPVAQLFAIRTLQALLAAWTAKQVYTLGSEAFSRRIGIFAGIGYALYGTLIFYETMLLIPVLFLFLLVNGALQFMRWLKSADDNPLIAHLVRAGLFFGLAAISRPNILLVMPLLAIAVFVKLYGGRSAETLIRQLKSVGVLTLAVCIPVFSVTLRNIIVTGETTLISTQGGINLYLGNNSEAEGLTMVMPEVVLDETVSWSQFTVVTGKIANREAGRALTPAERSSFWKDKALSYMLDNPGDFLSLTARKIVYIMLGFENSDNGNIYYDRQHSYLLGALLWEKPIQFPWGILFPFVALGMIVGWRERRRVFPLYLIIFGYLPTIFLFLVTARHRLALVPFALIFAGVGLFYLVDFIRAGKFKAYLAPALGIVIATFILNQKYFDIGFTNEAQIYQHQGITHERRGEWALAEQAYQKALNLNQQSHVLWNAMGFVIMRQNRIEEAAECFELASDLDPTQIESLLNYGQMLLRVTSFEGALKRFQKAAEIKPHDPRPIINIGDVYLRLNNYDSAMTFYKQAKDIAPEDKEVYFKLGELHARKKEYFEADNAFKRGAFFGAPSAIANLNWGNVYFSTNRTPEALAKYQLALRANPRMKQAWYSAGMCHFKLGSASDSVRYYLTIALRLDPDLIQAQEILNALELNAPR